MKVTLIDTMGSDLSVVNSARVSFAKESHLRDGLLDQKDSRLLRYLADHGHWTPFGHTSLSFRVTAPIYVARQLGKHQVGLVWNEVSRRYVDDTPTFDEPKKLRSRPDKSIKQGSDPTPAKLKKETRKAFRKHSKECLKLYEDLIDQGVCPEQARMVLPQSMETEWIWTGNLYAFHNVVEKRLHPTAQQEVRDVAHELQKHLMEAFPEAYKALFYRRGFS